MVQISGNTYPVREQIKALGGRWDAVHSCWVVADEVADECLEMVVAAGLRPDWMEDAGPWTPEWAKETPSGVFDPVASTPKVLLKRAPPPPIDFHKESRRCICGKRKNRENAMCRKCTWEHRQQLELDLKAYPEPDEDPF